MKTKFNRQIIPILLSSFIFACSSPKMAEWANKKDLTSKAKPDFNQNKIRSNGLGFSIDMKALGNMPSRVALVSFYVDDPGLTKTTKSPSTSSWNTTNIGEENARIFANKYYQESIQTLKENFLKYNVSLLTPSEFLTDDEKKLAYQNFVVQHTTLNAIGDKLNKMMKNLSSAHTTIETDAPADGFVLIKINKRERSDPKKKSVEPQNLNGSIDGRMIESIGYDLCKSLNVDAVLVVYNNILCDQRWNKDRYWFSALNMQLFGPNPIKLKDGKKDRNSYNKGLFYYGVRMAFKKGLLINPKEKRDSDKAFIAQQNKQAYLNMISGCTNKIGTYLQKELK
ncbi:MAG: hypothetical protein KA981_00310 [Bacteroidia bacterium]|nr:hypothetical protein [Bacteroidia bacterium]